ncbi:MAG: HD domain-containing phosphohydrolase [Thermodesulfobacteriota bacterium]
MTTIQIISMILVLPGALFMLASGFLSRWLIREVPPQLLGRWRALTMLVYFFFWGYVLFLLIQLEGIPFPLEIVTGAVFLGGAIFVFLVIGLSRFTIRKTRESEVRLLAANQTLAAKNTELEGEITARLAAESQARRRMQHLTTLHAIDLVITSNLDLRLTMRLFLEQIVPQLGVDAGAVLLLNPYTQILEYGAGWGFNTGIIEHSELRLGEGAAGQAAQERRMVILSPIDQPDSPFVRRELVTDERFVFYCAVPLVGKGQVKGVLELFMRREFVPEEEWKEFLDALSVQAAIAIDNATLFRGLQDSNAELILAYDTTIEGWSHALELRDKETEGHTQRATATTVRVARDMGLKEEQLVHVRRGALLHDIGKMAVPDTILMKDGPLTPEEQEVMRRHPRYAFELLAPIAYLRPAIDIPYCHHEWWDGSGYPRGLKGEQIPLPARIFAIADTWDALVSARRYHPAWSADEAAAHIRSLAGSQFDPALVGRFLEIVGTGRGNEDAHP